MFLTNTLTRRRVAGRESGMIVRVFEIVHKHFPPAYTSPTRGMRLTGQGLAVFYYMLSKYFQYKWVKVELVFDCGTSNEIADIPKHLKKWRYGETFGPALRAVDQEVKELLWSRAEQILKTKRNEHAV